MSVPEINEDDEHLLIPGPKVPWPSDTKLFQPFEAEQILLPDNASCLAIQAFLRMGDLKYEIVQRPNVDAMSAHGRVPLLKCGVFVLCDLDALLTFLETMGLSFCGPIDQNIKLDMRVYMSLMNTVFAPAELYVTWVDDDTYNQVTKVRNSSVHPWPLGWVVTFKKRRRVLKRLAALGWLDKTMDEVFDEVDSCCTALSERLGDNDYFINNQPTELDAVVFAHVFTILTTPLPSNQFAATVRCYPRLVNHCMRIEKRYFSGPNAGVNRPTLEENMGQFDGNLSID